jgi:hypothetical protein
VGETPTGGLVFPVGEQIAENYFKEPRNKRPVVEVS